MNRLNKTEFSYIVGSLYFCRLFRGCNSCRPLCHVELVKLLHVHRYSVDLFSYSGPSGILGSDGKQNTA